MTSYNLFLANFHFVRPFWLLAVIVLFIVLWLLKKHRFHQSPWQEFLPPHLSGVLVEGAENNSTTNKKPIYELLAMSRPLFIGLLTIIALAGPAWQKLPQPVYQTERGSVLIMDMSYSMYATDIKPNRLTRARFKAIDLLNKINQGDVGLIAYAGDAFVISPLTQDVKNIELLLPSLTPEIMPELGANPFAALTLAHEMLTNAGHLTGDIYWFTDDADNEELSDIYDWSNKFGHRLNILGIGSTNGAPIKLPSGELLKDNKGAIVVPKLPIQRLQALASRGHGNYQTITHNDNDIDNLLLTPNSLDNKSKQQESQQTGDQWQEQGAWLLLAVLALALSYFRRGGAVLLLPIACLPLLFLLTTSLVSPTAFANDNDNNNDNDNIENTASPSILQKTWQNLWQTQDQQAQQQYNQENFQDAAQQFENSQWQGSAHYKAGNYQEALDAFSQGEQANSASSLYNQGNSLAQMQKYEQAIEAYQQALQKDPNLQDAKDNMEKLKQQQKQEQQKDQQSNGDKSKDDKPNDKSDKQQQKQNGDSQQSQDESDKKQEQQSSQDSAKDAQQKDDQQEQSSGKNEQKESKDELKEKQAQQAKQDAESAKQGEEKTAAQIAAEQQAKEKSQKHQQLLNKVTDDPYLLLRNKMQLEYQKRRQDGASQGVQKKW